MTQHFTGPPHPGGQYRALLIDDRAQEAVDRSALHQRLPPDGTQTSQLQAWAPAPPPQVLQSQPLATGGAPLALLNDASCLPSRLGGWGMLPPPLDPVPPPVHWHPSHDGGRGPAHQPWLPVDGLATALHGDDRPSLAPPRPSHAWPAPSALNVETPSLVPLGRAAHVWDPDGPGHLSPSRVRTEAPPFGGHSTPGGRAAFSLPVGLPAVSAGGLRLPLAGRAVLPPPGHAAPPSTAAATAHTSGALAAQSPRGCAAISPDRFATRVPPGDPAAYDLGVQGAVSHGGLAITGTRGGQEVRAHGVPVAVPPGFLAAPGPGDPSVRPHGGRTACSSGSHMPSPPGGRTAPPVVDRTVRAPAGAPAVLASDGRATTSRGGRAAAPRGGSVPPPSVVLAAHAAPGGLTEHPPGGRQSASRGGRTAPARGGRTAPARGGRTASARGGRTAPARGGRTAPRRGGRAALLPRATTATPLQGGLATPLPASDVAAPVFPSGRRAPHPPWDGVTPYSQQHSSAAAHELAPPVFTASPTRELSASPFAPAGSSSVNSLLLEAAKRPKVAARRRGVAGAKVPPWSSDSSRPSQTHPGGPSGGRIYRPNVKAATGRRHGAQLPPRVPGGTAASSGVRPSDILRHTQVSGDEEPPCADPGPSQGARRGGSNKRASRTAKDRGPPAAESSWKMVHKEVKAMRAEHLHSMGRFDTATARLATVGQLVEATSAHCKNIADAVADMRRPVGSGSGDGRAKDGGVVVEADVDVVARWFRPVRVRCTPFYILVFCWGGCICCAHVQVAIC